MYHLLLAKGLWKYVDGSAALAEDADERVCAEVPESRVYTAKPQVYRVTSCETPKDIWDALRRHFERDTLSNKTLGRALDPRANGTWLSKLTE